MADRLAQAVGELEPEGTDRLAGAVGETEATERDRFRTSVMMEEILLEPDDARDPLRQGQIASELLQSFDEPANLQRDGENRVMLSTIFNIPLQDVMFMDRAMLKYMFNDELVSLADRFRKRPVEGGFFTKLGEAAIRGNENVSSDIAVYEAVFEGRGDPDKVITARNKRELEQLLTPIEGNMISDLFYKSAQIVPGMARGYWDAIPEATAGMLIGAAIPALAGQAGPQVALPEEVITVPAGAAIGLRAGLLSGSAQFWYKQGAGAAVAEMLGNGYDPEISRTVAGIAGLPYALIEASQVSALTPGLRKTLTTSINKTVVKVMGQAVKKYGKTLTTEVVQEIQQEIILISAEDISGILSDAGIRMDAEYIISRSGRIWETAKEATQAMALLPVPGVGIDVRTGVKQVLSARKQAEINSKLNTEIRRRFNALVPPAEEAPDVTGTLQALQAQSEAEAKLAAGTPLSEAERAQFPQIAEQEAQIAKLAETPPPEAPAPPRKAAPVAKAAPGVQPEGVEEAKAQEPTAKPEGAVDLISIDQELSGIEKQAADRIDIPFEGITEFGVIAAKAPHNAVKDAKLTDVVDGSGKLVHPETGKQVPAGLIGELDNTKIAINKTMIEEKSIQEILDSDPDITIPAELFENKEQLTEFLFEHEKAHAEIMAEGNVLTPKLEEQLATARTVRKLGLLQKAEKRQAQPPTEAGQIILPEPIQKGKAFKPVSKKGPGLTKAEQAALTPEQREELRFKQTQGEKVGFRAGERASREKAKVAIQKLKAAQKLTEGRRKTAVELVKAFVPKENQGDFLKRVSEAKTPRDLEKLTEAVDKGIVRAEKRDAIKELNKAVKAIKPKRMLPEFAGPAQAIIDSLQLGKLKEDTIVKNSDLKEMAQQVLDSARRDEQGRVVESISTFKAQQILDELRKKTTKTFAINQLSLEALEQITDTLTALRFQNTVDTIAAQEEKATEAIRRRKLIKEQITEPPGIPDEFGGAAVRKFKAIHDNLESVTDAVGGARPGTYDQWKKGKRALTEFVYDVLDRGVDNQATHNKQAGDILRGILTDNGVTKKEIISWSTRPEAVSKIRKLLGIAIKPDIHKFTLEDARGKSKEFDWTVNDLMSIFMHSRNSHNLAVLLNDGWDQTIKGKKVKIRGFTIEIIDNMIDVLTNQQKRVARQVGDLLMDGFNQDVGNQTSVKLVGFEIFTVNNYWPARRSIIRTPKGEALRPALRLIENMGILKERVGIGNPLKGIGFFETVHASNRNVSTYVGLAEPLREAKAVLSTDVLAEMEDSGREVEAKRILKHIEKIEGQLVPVFETELEEIVARMIGGFAKSKLFLNLKIAPRQQISEFLISAYVNPKYMAAFKGISSKALVAEISEISPQMQARIEGFQFDRDIGDAFQQNELLNYLTGDLSLIDKTGLGMRFFDTNAIVDIYRAVKAEVADKNPDIDINSDEGKDLLKDRFEWVVRHTQPVWHVKDRSLIGASRNPLVRIFSMFMSQREQMVRMVNNGISDFANSEKTVADQFRLGRTLGSVAFNLFMFSLYNFAWAVLVKKKKRDVWDFVRDSMKDVIGLPFFGKYFAEGFGISFDIVADKPVFQERFQEDPFEGVVASILIDGLVGFTKAAKDFVSGEKYQRGRHKGELKWKIELLVAMDSVIDAFAAINGLPYYGAKELGEIAKAQIPKE